MANSIGESLGSNGRPRVGAGISQGPQNQPGPVVSVPYSNFAGGINVSDNPEDVSENDAIYALDMELSRSSDLVRSPGFLEVQDCTARTPGYIMQQISLDYSTELVAIDPPYIGFKGAGDMLFVNVSLGATGTGGTWHGLSIAGTLLFSNGVTATYTREPAAIVVTDLSSDIIAKSFATAFGRIFAGGVTPPAGTYQALGISWNAANGNVDDWAGAGSGSELLIADSTSADKLVSMNAIGYDILGILCRHSLWAGYPTGVSNRPADFRPRVMSVGCVTQQAACAVPEGIAFLSDEGVMIYSINDVRTISAKINAELLPLNYSQLDRYQLIYMAAKQRLYLNTPMGIWIYEFPRGSIKERWLRRSFVADKLVAFIDQSGNIYWDAVVGTWAAQTRTWAEMVQGQSDAAAVLYATHGTKLGREDISTVTNFGTAYVPTWRTYFAGRDQITDQYTTLGYEIEYTSQESSVVSLRLTDSTGAFSGGLVTKTLPATIGEISRMRCWTNATGMNAALEIKITSGNPEIMRIRQLVRPAGPVQTSLP
jgi:hypothetical protein